MTNFKEYDDIIYEEDNPYDNPDTTFESEDSAFKAGVILAIENENGDAIDFDTEIDFTLVDNDIKKAFVAGYKKGADIRNERDYGDSEQEEINIILETGTNLLKS